ncbi:MAG TPA: hypothetical protein VII75_17010 [Thermoanaerobaculia bacterium]|nr:hypothetical protein [Thermoanaerobaculia bacterium]
MRRFSAVAVLAVLLSASTAHASLIDFPSREVIGRSRIVKLIKRLVTIVTGDQMSDPKP